MQWSLSQIKIFSLLVAELTLISCSREPRRKEHKLGEVFSISPIAVNYLLAPTKATTEAIKLNVMWGGRAISLDKGDTILNFYNQDKKLLFTKKWSDLSESYKTSSCNDQEIASLDGYLMGVALICDGSLMLQDVRLIEATDAKGERRSATSWGMYKINEQVSGVSLGFY